MGGDYTNVMSESQPTNNTLSKGQQVEIRYYPGAVEVKEVTSNFVVFNSPVTGQRFRVPHSLIIEGVKRGAITDVDSLNPPTDD